jgi:hypothetical protein
MQNSLLTCGQWAEQNFGAAQIGDCRRVRRLVKVAAALAACPGGTLPGAFPQWSQLKAAYRLLDNPALSFEKALAPHLQQVQAACAAPGQYLLIEDTTLLDFSAHPSLKGVGRIGDDGGRGLNLHTTLAFRVERWEDDGAARLSLLGLAGQHRWVRSPEFTRGPGVRAGYEAKKRKFSRPRESQRWARILTEFSATAAGNERIYIADRESDMYELFERCERAHCQFVVRACHNRALLEASGPLFETVGQATELGRYTLSLRARPGVPGRQATIAVRSARVKLRPPYRPGGKPAPRELNIVQARELDPPLGQGIEWFLLTSLDCKTCAQARRVIQLYACRWIIEEYHKALKTGAGIEKSQLEECHRVEALLAILSLVAVRLLNLKLQAAQSPTCSLEADEIAPEALHILEARFGAPPGGWTKRNLWIWIARLGGYLARNSDGPPGWQTLWRGWNRLREMTEGAQIVKARCG